ncbi:DNA-binding protein [Kineococcus aurantiacus]|uniref:DNA-binding protein n=1 Tax=Kineococcus aurantiacus TaxID=37633 RepID=UPI0031D3A388
MEHLFVVDQTTATPAKSTDLPTEKLLERAHLQEWVIANPHVLGDDVLIITSEYDRWAADTDGAPARDRLDILGIDRSGRLVVAELKRASAERDIHLQAITYAALVSRFTLDTLTSAHRDFLTQRGQPVDLDTARARVLDHVGDDFDPDILRRPRLVLLASSFPKQVTHTVVWLSEMNLDIDLVQVSLWRVGQQLVAGFTKVYPTPQAEEFTLAPAREEAATVVAKAQQRSRAQNAVHTIVAAGLLPDGAVLQMSPAHGVTDAQRATITTWASDDPHRARAVWVNNTAKPLRWEADGQAYSPTGLAQQICRQALDRDLDGIQGTTWWTLAPDQPIADGNAEGGTQGTTGDWVNDWSQLIGKDLVALAGETRDEGRDWSDLHAILAALPTGHWTTYGDIAAAIGSHAVPVGTHLARCTTCTAPWRVLRADATPSPGFRWSDPTRTDTVAEVLAGEGIHLTNGRANPTQRLTTTQLRTLADRHDLP